MRDALEEETWEAQREQYHVRLKELGDILSDPGMSEVAVQALHAMGSMTGHYLVACDKVYDRNRDFKDQRSLQEALTYLDGVEGALNDLRILRLYLRVWWQVHGEPQLFQEAERVCVQLSPAQWKHYAMLLGRRLAHPEEEGNARTRFSYAWALFQSGDYREAQAEFAVLEKQPLTGTYRAIRLATWCDSRGRPIPCKGTIRRLFNKDERGTVYVPQIRMTVPFLTGDFQTQNLVREGPLRDFFIAFNFRGPIADPERHYR
jgi:hypothetical protein